MNFKHLFKAPTGLKRMLYFKNYFLLLLVGSGDFVNKDLKSSMWQWLEVRPKEKILLELKKKRKEFSLLCQN